jgi:hypothetical protein
MDQSKGETKQLTEDQAVRVSCITWAMTACKDMEEPELIVPIAREFYQFLTGVDPVLDRGFTEEGTLGSDETVVLFKQP